MGESLGGGGEVPPPPGSGSGAGLGPEPGPGQLARPEYSSLLLPPELMHCPPSSTRPHSGVHHIGSQVVFPGVLESTGGQRYVPPSPGTQPPYRPASPPPTDGPVGCTSPHAVSTSAADTTDRESNQPRGFCCSTRVCIREVLSFMVPTVQQVTSRVVYAPRDQAFHISGTPPTLGSYNLNAQNERYCTIIFLSRQLRRTRALPLRAPSGHATRGAVSA